MIDDLCQCPRCGRMHRHLQAGETPLIISFRPDLERLIDIAVDNEGKRDATSERWFGIRKHLILARRLFDGAQ